MLCLGLRLAALRLLVTVYVSTLFCVGVMFVANQLRVSVPVPTDEEQYKIALLSIFFAFC